MAYKRNPFDPQKWMKWVWSISQDIQSSIILLDVPSMLFIKYEIYRQRSIFHFWNHKVKKFNICYQTNYCNIKFHYSSTYRNYFSWFINYQKGDCWRESCSFSWAIFRLNSEISKISKIFMSCDSASPTESKTLF